MLSAVRRIPASSDSASGASVSRTVAIDDNPEPIGHLRLVSTIARIAGWAWHAGAAAMAGILARAFFAPWFIDVELADPQVLGLRPLSIRVSPGRAQA